MKSHLVTYGQTVYDLVNKFYGSVEFTYKFISENPFITSVDYNFNANPGQTVVYDETFVKPKPKVIQSTTSATNNAGTILATEGQNIFDLCLMAGQPLENILQFIQDNGIVGVNTNNLSGREFIFNKEKIQDNVFHNFLKNNKIKINTGNFAKGTKRYLITQDGKRITTQTSQQITV